MAQAEVDNGCGDPFGLALVELLRSTGLNRAKSTTAGADISQDHKGRSALSPALADIGALSTLADGIQL